MTLLALALSNVIVAAMLAVLAWLAGFWGRRPALTHALWLLVLIKLVTPPLFECPIALPTMPDPLLKQAEIAVADSAPDQEELAAVAKEPLPSPDPMVDDLEIARVEPEIVPPTAPAHDSVAKDANSPEPVEETALWDAVDYLLLAWLAGSLGWMTIAIPRLWRFQRMVRFAEPAPVHVQEIARNLAWAMQVRCPEIGMLAGNFSPMLWSLGRSPRLLLPADLLSRLTPDQLATLLAHELAHWRRRDDRVRLLEFVVLAIYWWCPLAWWARRQLHHAEEECCDAWVVSLLPQLAKAYALALVETVDFLSGAPAPLPLAASGLGRVRFLKRRLTMILQGKTPRTLTFTGLLGVAALGFLMLPLVFSGNQDVQVGAQGDAKRGDETRAAQLEQARAEVEQMRKELDKFQQEMQKQHDMMRERAAQLEARMRRLRELEAAAAGGGRPGNGGGPAPGGRAGPEIGGAPQNALGGGRQADNNIDQRLKRLEAKLDTVLTELREMRKMRQGPNAGPGVQPPRTDPLPSSPNPFRGPRTESPPSVVPDPDSTTPPLNSPLPK